MKGGYFKCLPGAADPQFCQLPDSPFLSAGMAEGVQAPSLSHPHCGRNTPRAAVPRKAADSDPECSLNTGNVTWGTDE